MTPVLGGIALGFSWLLVAVSSPFETIPAPADGNGLNPSLQNPYMVAHPVFLYLGYVGLAVPFAFAMGALLRTDGRALDRRDAPLDARRVDGSGSGSSSARTGPTRRWGGAGTTPGTPSRTRR